MTDTPAARRALVGRLFPGVPRLWCPLLTHFAAAGQPDPERIRRHLASIAPYVKGLLIPGSTGEGWQMSDADIRGVLEIVLDAARPAGIGVLVGVLKTTEEAVQECITATLDWLIGRTDAGDPENAMAQAGVVGFTVCPPAGEGLSQEEIQAALGRVLDRGLPVALYQLPQVTHNEMAPETVQSLAGRYPNFILFKDTSGEDRVALSGLELGGVFLVRGADGGYDRWMKPAGPYDGYLLSTANTFASELHTIQSLLAAGRPAEAAALARRVEQVVERCFAMAAGLPAGNAFTNANKTLDHIRAHGPAWRDAPAPLLFGGERLPAEFLESAAGWLREDGFEMVGYLN